MSQFAHHRDSPAKSEVVGSKSGYVITAEHSTYWTKYILWSPDGRLIQKNSSFEEIEKARDAFIARDATTTGDEYD